MKRSFDKLMEWYFTPIIVFGVSFLLTNNSEVSLAATIFLRYWFSCMTAGRSDTNRMINSSSQADIGTVIFECINEYQFVSSESPCLAGFFYRKVRL